MGSVWLNQLFQLCQNYLCKLDLWGSLRIFAISTAVLNRENPWNDRENTPNDRERTVKFVKLNHGNFCIFLLLYRSYFMLRTNAVWETAATCRYKTCRLISPSLIGASSMWSRKRWSFLKMKRWLWWPMCLAQGQLKLGFNNYFSYGGHAWKQLCVSTFPSCPKKCKS